jgi:hypothetical protein
MGGADPEPIGLRAVPLVIRGLPLGVFESGFDFVAEVHTGTLLAVSSFHAFSQSWRRNASRSLQHAENSSPPISITMS